MSVGTVLAVAALGAPSSGQAAEPDFAIEMEGDLRLAKDGWLDGARHGLVVTTKASEGASTDEAEHTAWLSIDGVDVPGTSVPCVEAGCKNTTFSVDTGDLDEGQHVARLVARVGGAERTEEWRFSTDVTPPKLELSGSLRDAEGTTISGPEYGLTVEASDDSAAGRTGTGAPQIDISVRGRTADQAIYPCREGGCGLSHDFTYKTTDYPAGAQDVKVVVTDRVGNRTVVTWAVNNASPDAGCVGRGVNSAGQQCSGYAKQCVASDAAGEPEEAGRVPSNEAMQTVAREWPELTGQSVPAKLDGKIVDPTLKTSSLGLVASGTIAPATIATDAAGGMSLGAGAFQFCVTPSETDEDRVEPTVVGDAAVFPATEQATDTIIRPVAAGLEVFKQIHDASAPNEFSWDIDLPARTRMVELDEHSVAIVLDTPPTDRSDGEVEASSPDLESVPRVADQLDQVRAEFEMAQRVSSMPIAVISARWAEDAAGSDVPVTLEASGERVTMRVHVNTHTRFPVVADPTFAGWQPLVALTWNIKGNRPHNCATPPTGTNPFANFCVDRIADVIKNQAPSIAGLQEVCNEDIWPIQQALNARSWSMWHETDLTGVVSGGCSLADSVFGYTGSGYSRWKAGPYTPVVEPPQEQRRIQSIHFVTGQAQWRVFNTHLAQPGTLANAATCDFQYETHYESLGAVAYFSPSPIDKLIMGDMNVKRHPNPEFPFPVHPQCRGYNLLSGIDGAPLNYGSLDDVPNSSAWSACTAFVWQANQVKCFGHIDYMFMAWIYTTEAYVPFTDASDHRPIRAVQWAPIWTPMS